MNLNLYNRAQSSFNLHRDKQCKSKGLELPLLSPEKSNFPSFNSDRNEYQKYQSFNFQNDSQFNVCQSFPSRPDTSKLSGLTLQENEKFLLASGANTLSTQRLHFRSIDVPRLPSDQDFDRILSKLDMVSSNRTGHRRITLQDSEPCQLALEKGHIQYFTIKSLNKKPPLLLNTKKKSGSIVIYVSKITPEPSRSNCDTAYSRDFHYINDIGLKFKIENFFLGVEALSDCEFSITVSFGKRPQRKKQLIKPEDFQDEGLVFQNFVGEEKKEEEIKDFIKFNKEHSNVRLFTSRHSDYDKRRNLVIINKIKNIENKKQKTLNKLHKHEFRREQEKKEREELQKQLVSERKQKIWLTFLFFSSSVQAIKELINTQRSIKLEKIRKSFQVHRIQKMCRTSIGVSPNLITLTRANLNLRLFRSAKSLFTRKLVLAVKESAKNSVMPFAFKSLFFKLSFIIKHWRNFKKRMGLAREALIRQWNSVMEEKILKFSRSQTKRKKNLDSRRFTLISINLRNTMLEQHILACKKKFISQMNDYRESKKRLVEQVLRHINLVKLPQASPGNPPFQFDPPRLQILPSNAEMSKLIDKALLKIG